MQCRHCGSIIRDNVKYCTMCGKSVFEIRNSIINNETTDKMKEQVVNVGNKVADNVKNVSNKVAENIKSIDTDKMKEQFRNVSNNVVENVKNFDKEQAKQKTMNFASNVKTDVKNFKTLSTTKKRNYIIALVVVILLIFFIVPTFTKKTNTIGVKVTSEKQMKNWVESDKRALEIVAYEMSKTGYQWEEMEIRDKDNYGRYIIYIKASNPNTGKREIGYKFLIYSKSTENYVYNLSMNIELNTKGLNGFDYKHDSRIKWGQPLSTIGLDD